MSAHRPGWPPTCDACDVRSRDGERRRRLSQDGRYTPIGRAHSSDALIDPMLLAQGLAGSATHPPGRKPAVDVRGRRNALYAARGGIRARRSTRQCKSDAEDDDEAVNNDEPFAPDPSIPKDDSDPLNVALLNLRDLDAMQKVARKEISVRSRVHPSKQCARGLTMGWNVLARALSASSFVKLPRSRRTLSGRCGVVQCRGCLSILRHMLISP